MAPKVEVGAVLGVRGTVVSCRGEGGSCGDFFAEFGTSLDGRPTSRTLGYPWKVVVVGDAVAGVAL